MEKVTFDIFKQFKVADVSDEAFSRVVAGLKRSRRAKWQGGRVTQEAAFNAICLWLASMDPEAIETAMAEWLPRLEAMMRGQVPAEVPIPQTKKGPAPPLETEPGYTVEITHTPKKSAGRRSKSG